MKTDELRAMYLDFFKSKGHTFCKSDVLVPKWDHSVLFTPAGMNPFKDHFLGKVDLEFTKATSCQKCLRTGDIENVGRTAYHHTFFEMLGNFSFGDYFKRDAIHWAWEFLTDKKWLALDPDRLTVTVYLDDDEASDIWHKDVGLSLDKISRLDEYENFWPAGAPSNGPDGVCGPCSEIFYHPDNGPECEIWNLVFTQFNRSGDPPNNLGPLPSKNIDTGMGLERMAAMLQGVETNFHIDSLRPIVDASAEVCGLAYDPKSENGRRLRRIADHIRACTMAIHENVYPGAAKEEYVIRRLLRRGVLQGHDMGVREPFMFKIVPAVVDAMSGPYPDLKETAERVAQVIEREESRFLDKLDDGLNRIEKVFGKMKSSGAKMVDGKVAAELYQTYGMPSELFESIAEEQGFKFDREGYDKAMDQHGEASGKIADTVMGDSGPIDDIKREVKSTEFQGYESTQSNSPICGLVSELNQSSVRQTTIRVPADKSEHQIVFLKQTPFYAESGGQVGDTGEIKSETGTFQVSDTQKNGDVFLHFGNVVDGEIADGQSVTATVDVERRKGIQRAHTATHILHYALQQNLGEHAQQRGSKVEDDLLRFDFANMEPVSSEQLATIESLSNEKVSEGCEVKADVLPLDDARQRGAMMLFGEKYPDPVRMVSIGEFSRELCGGIHVANSSDIELLEIISEDNISAGTRRIQALTGDRAKKYRDKVITSISSVADLLGTDVENVPKGIEVLQNAVKKLRKQLSSGKTTGGDEDTTPVGKPNREFTYFESRASLKAAANMMNVSLFDVPERVSGMIAEIESLKKQITALESADVLDADGLIAAGQKIGDVLVISQNLPGANSGLMRQLIDSVRKKTDSVALFLAAPQGSDKVILVAGVSRSLVERGLSAGEWVKAIAPTVGGGGGGKPDLAQAGGKNPAKIGQALAEAIEYMKTKNSG